LYDSSVACQGKEPTKPTNRGQTSHQQRVSFLQLERSQAGRRRFEMPPFERMVAVMYVDAKNHGNHRRNLVAAGRSVAVSSSRNLCCLNRPTVRVVLSQPF
jgi:copper(I)-binding protein